MLATSVQPAVILALQTIVELVHLLFNTEVSLHHRRMDLTFLDHRRRAALKLVRSAEECDRCVHHAEIRFEIMDSVTTSVGTA